MSAEDARAFGVEKRELEGIWPDADYITVHTPLIPETRSESCFNILYKQIKILYIVSSSASLIIANAHFTKGDGFDTGSTTMVCIINC